MCVAEDLPSEIVSLPVIPTQEEAPVIAVRAVRVKTRPTWWKDYVVETKVNYRWIVNHHWSLALFFLFVSCAPIIWICRPIFSVPTVTLSFFCLSAEVDACFWAPACNECHLLCPSCLLWSLPPPTGGQEPHGPAHFPNPDYSLALSLLAAVVAAWSPVWSNTVLLLPELSRHL